MQWLQTQLETTLQRTRWIKVMAASMLAMWLSGCEATVFGFVNRGLPPPDKTVPFAPDVGLSMDVQKPHMATGTKAPIVVFFYGGSWQRGARAQYQFVGRRFRRGAL